MLTPKRKGGPGWSPKTPSPLPPAEDMAGSSHVATAAATTRGSSGGRDLVEAPPRNLLDNNGEIMATRGESEIWRRFNDARSLNQESLEKKYRVVLVVHVTKLEAEIGLSILLKSSFGLCSAMQHGLHVEGLVLQ